MRGAWQVLAVSRFSGKPEARLSADSEDGGGGAGDLRKEVEGVKI